MVWTHDNPEPERAATSTCHTGRDDKSWAGGGQIWASSLHSQCDSVQLLVPWPAFSSALSETDYPRANVISALLWTKKKLTSSSSEFDDFERQGKTISSHLSRSLFTSLGLVAQSCLTLCDPMDVACRAPLSMGFSRQKYWSGLPFPSPLLPLVKSNILSQK